MTESSSRLRREHRCPGGLDVFAVRQPDGTWHVGPFVGRRLGIIYRRGERRWEARPDNSGFPTIRAALWAAVHDLCPRAHNRVCYSKPGDMVPVDPVLPGDPEHRRLTQRDIDAQRYVGCWNADVGCWEVKDSCQGYAVVANYEDAPPITNAVDAWLAFLGTLDSHKASTP